MSETVRQKAQEITTELAEINAVQLSDVPESPNAAADEIAARIADLDMSDTNSIVRFGSAAQSELQEISQAMLADVRNKEVGPAGDSLREIVSTIRGFSVSELDGRRNRSWWEKLIGRAAPIAKFYAQYETVQGQIDRITEELLNHEHALMKDIRSLDFLYDKTLDF